MRPGSRASSLETARAYVLSDLKEALREHFDSIRIGSDPLYDNLAGVLRPGDFDLRYAINRLKVPPAALNRRMCARLTARTSSWTLRTRRAPTRKPLPRNRVANIRRDALWTHAM